MNKLEYCRSGRHLMSETRITTSSGMNQCSVCASESAANWKENNPERVKIIQLRRNLKQYGLTIDQYNQMYKDHNGECAICGGYDDGKRLSVDHSYNPWKVRGLLCSNCNHGIGKFKDSKRLLYNALEYLEKHHPDKSTLPFAIC